MRTIDRETRDWSGKEYSVHKNVDRIYVGSGNLHQEEAELRALKKRIKDLEEENEFLKKASAFFAKNLK